MLTQLSTVKTRLAIDEFDLTYDTILTNAINAISSRFDKETNRTLARTVNITQEFDATDTTKGIILKSPGGTRYRIKVADGGSLSTEVVP